MMVMISMSASSSTTEFKSSWEIVQLLQLRGEFEQLADLPARADLFRPDSGLMI